jgi:hypothetical protein
MGPISFALSTCVEDVPLETVALDLSLTTIGKFLFFYFLNVWWLEKCIVCNIEEGLYREVAKVGIQFLL